MEIQQIALGILAVFYGAIVFFVTKECYTLFDLPKEDIKKYTVAIYQRFDKRFKIDKLTSIMPSHIRTKVRNKRNQRRERFSGLLFVHAWTSLFLSFAGYCILVLAFTDTYTVSYAFASPIVPLLMILLSSIWAPIHILEIDAERRKSEHNRE